jgi:thiol-disulfide isomerase/thioredoxin
MRKSLTLLAALSLTAMPARGQESGIAVGTKAPTPVVQGVDGRSVDLGQYVGKVPVLIEFWATWCPNCKELEPSVLAAHRKYGAQVKFIGVAVSVNQSPERVKLYADKHKLPLELLYDHTGAATDAYEVPATSYVVVIDRRGTVVYTGLGGDQDLDAAIRKAL